MDADEYLDGASQLISEWVIQKLKYQANWKQCQNAKGYPQLGYPNP